METEAKSLRRFRIRLACSLIVIGILVAVGYAVSPWIKLGINRNESIEGTFFIILKGARPDVGHMAAFWPPQNQLYRNTWFVKYLRGQGGDVVRVDTLQDHFLVYINDVYVGPAFRESESGKELTPIPPGVIPAGKYFVWAPHPRSFDSRYSDIGYIDESDFIGRAIRLF